MAGIVVIYSNVKCFGSVINIYIYISKNYMQ